MEETGELFEGIAKDKPALIKDALGDIQGYYTVTAGAYGKFLVNEEQYNDISVGDEIPEYLKGRGH